MEYGNGKNRTQQRVKLKHEPGGSVEETSCESPFQTDGGQRNDVPIDRMTGEDELFDGDEGTKERKRYENPFCNRFIISSRRGPGAKSGYHSLPAATFEGQHRERDFTGGSTATGAKPFDSAHKSGQ